jgi:DNA-binding XRE family transcriptional regulator
VTATARGLTQRQIAEQLGVERRTVLRWLSHFGTVPECDHEPTLPDAATLATSLPQDHCAPDSRARQGPPARAPILNAAPLYS